MSVYYNDSDAHACQWLRNLMDADLIPRGTVDERQIQTVETKDLDGYDTCHFFAGIGGWGYALSLAGWPATRPVWTASLPCQPFSGAGKRKGQADERHLWPVFLGIVRECKPATIFGEQVASDDGYRWLARVRDDLEEEGYAVGCADLPASCQGAPHIRQRLFWVANATSAGREADPGRVGLHNQREGQSREIDGGRLLDGSLRCGSTGGLANREEYGRGQWDSDARGSGSRIRAEGDGCGPANSGEPGGMGHTWNQTKLQRGRGTSGTLASEAEGGKGAQSEPGRVTHASGNNGSTRRLDDAPDERGGLSESTKQSDDGANNGVSWQASPWSDFDIVHCADGKSRRTQRGLFPLADGTAWRLADGTPGHGSRTKALRGIGNAIVAQVAALFIRAFMETERTTHA